jgi:hypothetical protein
MENKNLIMQTKNLKDPVTVFKLVTLPKPETEPRTEETATSSRHQSFYIFT